MWYPIFRKLFRWIPAVGLLCLIGFLLLKFIPGDPVLARLQESGVRVTDPAGVYHSREYREIRTQYGLDLPVFYFSLKPATVPDTLYHIPHPGRRSMMKSMCIHYGNPQAVMEWYRVNRVLELVLVKNEDRMHLRVFQELMVSDQFEDRENAYSWLITNVQDPEITAIVQRAAEVHREIPTNAHFVRSLIPSATWHGTNNQFHHWLLGYSGQAGILGGNFGTSHRDGQPVGQKVWPAFTTTLVLAFLSVALMYLVSIPLGLQLARSKNRKNAGAWIRIILSLYAMPGFWLGVLLMTFLCSPDFLNWFPVAYSLMDIQPDTSVFHRTAIIVYHLILPVTCWTIGGAAFLTIQTYRQSQSIQGKPFFLAARAKGLSDSSLTWRHVRPNAALPAVSMLGSIVPAALSGAIAIELIFSIPGMGQLIFDAFHTRDYPVVMAILMLVGTAAILSTAFADLLLHRIDPRTKTGNQE